MARRPKRWPNPKPDFETYMTTQRMQSSPGLGAARLALSAALVLTLTGAQAQPGKQPAVAAAAPAAPCPAAKQILAPQLYGQWLAVFDKPPRGLPVQALVQLEQHAEFSDSLAGMVQRNLSAAPGGKVAGHATRAQLAGDMEAGTLLLDESSNGTSLTASWDGQVVEGSCGRTIRGVWKDLSSEALPDAPDVPFVLTQQRGW
jgi:hypothetical protein